MHHCVLVPLPLDITHISAVLSSACPGCWEHVKNLLLLQEQVQALRADNIALAASLAEAQAATSALTERAERANAQQLQRETFLHAQVEEAKRGLATAQQHAAEARRERDFFMSQSTEATTQAASATADRDTAKQVLRAAPWAPLS